METTEYDLKPTIDIRGLIDKIENNDYRKLMNEFYKYYNIDNNESLEPFFIQTLMNIDTMQNMKVFHESTDQHIHKKISTKFEEYIELVELLGNAQKADMESVTLEAKNDLGYLLENAKRDINAIIQKLVEVQSSILGYNTDQMSHINKVGEVNVAKINDLMAALKENHLNNMEEINQTILNSKSLINTRVNENVTQLIQELLVPAMKNEIRMQLPKIESARPLWSWKSVGRDLAVWSASGMVCLTAYRYLQPLIG